MTPDPRRPCCDTCGRPVRRWQRYDGFGPVGFNRRTAAILWHSKCGISESEQPWPTPIP